MDPNTWILVLSYISQFVVQSAITLLLIGFHLAFEEQQKNSMKKTTKTFLY